MYPLIENRQIRVFISSTFEDMKPERDHLMKKVFPRLRKQAAERDVSLVEIDLRWGITQKQAERGEVLQICLNEIDNSHPFFIGLLGNRYGSSPKPQVLKQHPILKERYPWISDDVAKQLGFTEIEMQYGALRRNEKDLNAYFFIKDVTVDDPQQIALRDAVSNDSRYTHDKYTSVEELGQKIEKEFSKLLDRLFPEKNLTQLELDRLAQRAFRRSRCHVYVRNEPDFKRLNDFLDDNSRYLVVTGESGMGKSSLIANWLSDHEKDDRYNIIYHFVGNTGGDADHGRILSRLIDEVYDLYDIPRPDGDRLGMNNRRKPEEVLQDLLMQASAMKPLLIVLDGINQLAELGEESPKLLNWLPSVPIGSKMLFSTLADDETMATFKRRQYPIYKIKALDSKPRRELIVKYLKRYGKELTPAQVARIADDAENKNTLVLRTLLDELLCFGDYQLDGIINYYLSAESIDDFFQRVLQRAERDYGQWLVRDTMSLIAVSYAGMSEKELIDMARILPLHWSAFYCAFATHFTVKNGLVNFSHRYLYNAVVTRYFDSISEPAFRQRVIYYFTNSGAFADRTDTSEEHRTWSELVHQYYCTKSNKELHALVLRPEVFEYFISDKGSELVALWQQLRNDTSGDYSLADYLDPNTYCDVFKHYESSHYFAKQLIAHYFLDVGSLAFLYFREYNIAEKAYKESLEIYRHLAHVLPEIYAQYDDKILHYLGELHCAMKDYFISETELKESLENYRRLSLKNPDAYEPQVVKVLMAIGNLHFERKEFAKAKKAYQESLEICRRLVSKFPEMYERDVANLLNNIGNVYIKLNDCIAAEKTYQESLEISLRLATKNPDAYESYIAASFNNLGNVYKDLTDYAAAEKRFVESLEIRRQLAFKYPDVYESDVADTLNNLGSLHRELQNWVTSEKEFRESLEIRRQLAFKYPDVYESDVATALNNIGAMHHDINEYVTSETEFKESLEIRRLLASKYPDVYESDVAITLQNLACVHIDLTYYSAAEKELNESLEISRKLVNKTPEVYDYLVAKTLFNLGNLHRKLKDHTTAIKKYKESIMIYRQITLKSGGSFVIDMVNALQNLSHLYYDREDYKLAEEGYLEALEICRSMVSKNYIVYSSFMANTLYCLGRLHLHLDKYTEAKNEYEDALRILRQLPNYHDSAMYAYIIFDLGLFYLSVNEDAEAKNNFDKSLMLFQDLDKRFPGKYSREILMASNLVTSYPSSDE